MSLFDAIILGIVQGLTEFFPVSSSTHLKFAKMFLGIKDPENYLLFDLFCHLGTVMAAIFFFRREIKDVFLDKKIFFLFFLALLPLIPCYFLFKPLREAESSLQGYCLILTAALLFSSSLIKDRPREACNKRKFKDVLFIGAMQGMALIPGISRSGSTISAALFRGWDVKEAVRFSFLLAIPTVLGGSFLECAKIVSHSKELVFSLPACLLGFGASLLVGLLGVRLISLVFKKKNLRPFALYCLFLGILSLIYLR